MICNTFLARNIFVLALFLLPVSTSATEQPAFENALKNAHDARLALSHVHAFLRYWTAHKDSRTALIASGPGLGRWTVRGTASEIYPALVSAAYLTDLPFFNGLLRETLHDETLLTARISNLPDDYDLNTGRFRHSTVDTERIVAAAAEYAATGLLPIASQVGNDVWTYRLEQLTQTIFTLASVQTTFSNGPLPSEYAETNGNLLRVLSWLATHTNNPTYLEWARRIADAYCLGVMPSNGGLPAHHWDFVNDKAQNPALILNHAGRVLIEGLASLYATEVRLKTSRADIYRPTLSYMFDILLTRARNPEGFFYARIEPDSRGGSSIDRKNRSAEWSHLLAAAMIFGKASENPAYIEPVQAFLKNLPDTYPRTWTNLPESLPGDLPGILSILDELQPDTQTFAQTQAWIDREFSTILAAQATNNQIENPILAHAALAYAHQKTRSIRLLPWRDDLVFGAQANEDTLSLAMSSDTLWQGRLSLPAADTVQLQKEKTLRIAPNQTYQIYIPGAGGSALWAGELLLNGLPVQLNPEQPRFIRLLAAPPSPESGTSAPTDTSRIHPLSPSPEKM